MQAIILAGGRGTRLKPYTTILPKPLMPVGDIPILEIILKQLKYYGFQEVILALGHKAKFITTFFDNGTDLGLNITYSYEQKDLGTAGPLTLIENMDDNFLVMNGDVLTDLNFKEFYETHLRKDAAITIATYLKTIKIDLGVMETIGNKLVSYFEKPSMTHQVSMGVYAFNRRTIDYIPHIERFDFPDLVNRLINAGETINVYAPEDCIWLDIGNIEDFQQSSRVFEKNMKRFLPNL